MYIESERVDYVPTLKKWGLKFNIIDKCYIIILNFMLKSNVYGKLKEHN